jgi:hypothetical protein
MISGEKGERKQSCVISLVCFSECLDKIGGLGDPAFFHQKQHALFFFNKQKLAKFDELLFTVQPGMYWCLSEVAKLQIHLPAFRKPVVLIRSVLL